MINIIMLFAALQAPSAAIVVNPPKAFIEHLDGHQFVNFDFDITNTGRDTIELFQIDLTVRDRQGGVEIRRQLDENGFVPGIETVPRRRVAPGEATTVFNPFHEFADDVALGLMSYTFHFRTGKSEFTVDAEVRPTFYRQVARLELPLRGRLLAYDDHDFYAHHRRLPLSHPAPRSIHLKGNSARYAYDLSIVDSLGRMYRGDGKRNEDWYSWNQPVLATGDGVVVAARNDRVDQAIAHPDFSFDESDLTATFGNHVIIDHGNGEFSLLAHMRQGSVVVKVGDRVKIGQMVGRVGFSGSVITIHTHYQLQSGPVWGDEGLPSYFSNFERLRGARATPIARGTFETGDIVRSKAARH